MKAQELRIGNLYYYKMVDKCDERKEWEEVTEIDSMDFDHLLKSPDDQSYNPIPLTADWLERCGCKKLRDGMYRFGRFDLRWVERYKFWNVTEIACQAYITKVEFVHEWQNVVAVLNGYELKFKTK